MLAPADMPTATIDSVVYTAQVAEVAADGQWAQGWGTLAAAGLVVLVLLLVVPLVRDRDKAEDAGKRAAAALEGREGE